VFSSVAVGAPPVFWAVPRRTYALNTPSTHARLVCSPASGPPTWVCRLKNSFDPSTFWYSRSSVWSWLAAGRVASRLRPEVISAEVIGWDQVAVSIVRFRYLAYASRVIQSRA